MLNARVMMKMSVLLATAAVAATEVLAAAAAPEVRTSLGVIRGNALLEAEEYLGIPYGSAARFTAAKPRTNAFDDQPLIATYYGPACKQTLTANKTYGLEHGCHVLNVWRPAHTAADAKLPVMLYVPGGSNDFGEAEPYNASQMAAHQHAIICSINYRVGPFGFVSFAEDRLLGVTTGNHALTDIQAALRFLRAHIHSFGGDPSRLTLFGQSSGASLCLLHAVIPSSAGLVEGIVSQSGTLGAASFQRSLETTQVLAKALNCTERGYLTAKRCLLDATSDELVFAQGVVCITPNDCSALTSWSPAVDGVLLPDEPAALVARHAVNPIAVALGANTNDSYLFIQNEGPRSRRDYLKDLRAEAGSNTSLADELVALYPPHWGDNIDRVGWYSSDKMLCGLRRLARSLAAAKPTGGRVHLYRYDYWFQSNKTCTAVSNYHEPELGSMHQDEVSFVFGQPIFMNIGYTNCSAPGWAGFNPTCLGCVFDDKEAQFSRAVGRLWTRFAATGDARGEWPRFGEGGRNVLLEPTTPTSGGVQRMRSEAALGRPRECEAWDAVAGA